jgi:hypothetical protein
VPRGTKIIFLQDKPATQWRANLPSRSTTFNPSESLVFIPINGDACVYLASKSFKRLGTHGWAKLLPFFVNTMSPRFVSTTHEIFRKIFRVRAHGMWTYEPRQGRKAATVVCSVSAVVTLTL